MAAWSVPGCIVAVWLHAVTGVLPGDGSRRHGRHSAAVSVRQHAGLFASGHVSGYASEYALGYASGYASWRILGRSQRSLGRRFSQGLPAVRARGRFAVRLATTASAERREKPEKRGVIRAGQAAAGRPCRLHQISLACFSLQNQNTLFYSRLRPFEAR